MSQRVVSNEAMAFDGYFFDGAVHPTDLAICAWMHRPDEPVIDVFCSSKFEAVGADDLARGIGQLDLLYRGAGVLWVAEMDVIVGEHNVDFVRHCGCEMEKEVASDSGRGLGVQFGEGELEVRPEMSTVRGLFSPTELAQTEAANTSDRGRIHFSPAARS